MLGRYQDDMGRAKNTRPSFEHRDKRDVVDVARHYRPCSDRSLCLKEAVICARDPLRRGIDQLQGDETRNDKQEENGATDRADTK